MKKIITLLIALIVCLPIAKADVSKDAVKINLNGGYASLSWSADDPLSKTVYAITKGNNASNLNISLSAPKGTKIKVSLATASGSITETLKNPKRFFKLPLYTDEEANALSSSPCVTFSPGESSSETDDVPEIERPETSSPLCDIFTADDFAAIGTVLTALYGGTWSNGQVCGYLVNNYLGGAEPCDPTDPICAMVNALNESEDQIAYRGTKIYKSYVARLSRNACAPAKTKYILKIDIKVPTKSLPADAGIQVYESEFQGDMAASIKPVSDGMFAHSQ